MTEKNKKERVIINIIDGVPCILLPPGTLGKKLQPRRTVPFTFGTIQEEKKKDTMPDVMDELKKFFKEGDFRVSYFKLPEPKKEDKKNKDDN